VAIDRLTCCVCGGEHHPLNCARAQKYMRQCTNTRISAPPPGAAAPVEPYRRTDHDWICKVLREAMLDIDVADAAAAYRHHRLNWERHLAR
jgi:hypothetical protein